MKILQNEIICNKCGDQIYSAHRHDFKDCKCGAVSVDGGTSYFKRCGNREDYQDISVAIEDEVFKKAIEALKWSKDNGRNEFGALCALFRAFRECGHELRKKDE